MTASAVEVYAMALESREPALRVLRQDGRVLRLALDRWLGPVTAADEAVLERARPPVLDVGCGPGRHVLALARRGRLALGVDIAPAAVRVARHRGAAAIEAAGARRARGERERKAELDGQHSRWFPWARVGSGAIELPARAVGFAVAERWEMERRWFARLIVARAERR